MAYPSAYPYFYVGLEGKLKSNKYYKLQDALAAAAYSSKKQSIPVRVFMMKPDKKNELVKVVEPYEADDYICFI